MELLAELTAREADRLWWRIVRAIAATSDEIECLAAVSEQARTILYGPGVLDQYKGLRAELADLADNDIRRTVASWNDLLADVTEERDTQWLDLAGPTPPRRLTWTQRQIRAALVRWNHPEPR